MNSEAMQKPIADESADDANRRVANETEPVAADNLASQPSGNVPTTKMTSNPWSDRCMLSLQPGTVRAIFRAVFGCGSFRP